MSCFLCLPAPQCEHRRIFVATTLLISALLYFSFSAHAQTVPPSRHVILVIEENQSYSTVTNSGNSTHYMPWLIGEGNTYGHATNYTTDSGGSLLDYLWLSSGSCHTNNTTCAPSTLPANTNNFGCNGNNCSAIGVITDDNIFRELSSRGMSFKIYLESLPSVGYTGGDTNNYVIRHNPGLWYSDVGGNSSGKNAMVPFTQFATDLANNTLPEYSIIVPNLQDDAHDGTPQAADNWLQANVAPVLNQSYFQAGGDGLLIITFDNGDADNPGQVYTAVIGPNVVRGFVSNLAYKHENTLRTILDALQITTRPGASGSASPMADFFTVHSTGSVTITSPTDGETTTSQQVLVSASATESGATIDHLEVWDNGTKLGNSPPGSTINETFTLPFGTNQITVEDISTVTFQVLHQKTVTITVNSGTPVVIPPAGDINTIAGNGTQGYTGDSGAATGAELGGPPDVAVDSAGNIYIADTSNNVIRKVTAGNGIITTVAGNGTAGYTGDGGAATSATLNFPFGLAVDGNGNIYIADANNQAIRKVTASTGIITTVAGNGTAGYSGDGGAATSAEIDEPLRVAMDSDGNFYFSDPNNNVIRKVTVSTGIITTAAGNGTAGYTGDGGQATNAELSNPYGVAVDGAGNIYIADRANSVIRKVTESTGVISTVAGNGTQGYSGDGGPATSAAIWGAPGVAADSAGNIYIADANNDAIRKVTASTGIITTVAGNGSFGFSGDGGPATSAALADSPGVAVDGNGNIYIADKFNNRIRVVGGSGGGGGSNHQLSNFDDITTGWLQCTGPSCAGGTGTPTSTSQTFGNASPALDGGSMMLSESGPSYSNNAWYFNTGKDDSNTNFTLDLQFNVPSTAQLQTLEFTQFQYLLAGNGGATANTRLYFATQCLTGGNWNVWDQGLTKWVDTGVACNYVVSSTAFNHLTINVHRVAGDTSCANSMPCQYYDSITLNGTVVVSNMKTSAGPLPSGWSEQTGLFLQMGTNGICSSGCTIKEFIDQGSFSY